MSGGIDWGAGQREIASMCSANCTSATPLTTTFIAPSSCAQYWTPSSVWQAAASEGPQIYFTRNFTETDCLPSQLRPTIGHACTLCPESSSAAYVSPGLCPQGWSAPTTAIVDGVTTEHCCPPEAPTWGSVFASTGQSSACIGSSGAGLFTFSFSSIVYYSTSTSVPPLTSGQPTSWVTFNTTTVEAVRTTTYAYSARYSASPLIVQYKQADFPTTSTLSSASSPTTTNNPPSSDVPPSGLSTGAKAGTGVGIALGVLSLLLLGVFLLHKKRQKRKATQAPPAQHTWDHHADQKAELHNETIPPKELPAHDYREASLQEPAELGAYR